MALEKRLQTAEAPVNVRFYKTKRIDARLHSLQGRARKENKSAIFFNIY